MRGTISAAGLALVGLAWLAIPAQAAPLSQTPGEAASGIRLESMIEQVQRRGYCRRWHRECRLRWGGGPRFRRCMIRNGC